MQFPNFDDEMCNTAPSDAERTTFISVHFESNQKALTFVLFILSLRFHTHSFPIV